MAKGFTYQKRDTSAVSARAEQKGSTFLGIIKDDFTTWRPKKGNNYVRFLPPTWDGADHYGMDVYAHFGVGPDRATVLCLNKMQNKKCPLCEETLKAERAEDKELANELRARKQVLAWIIDLDAKDKGPMLWSQSWTIDRDIARVCRDQRTGEVFFIDHPDEGYNVAFDREGDGKTNTKYGGFKIDRKPSSVEPEWLEWVQEFPIPECLEWRDYDEIMTLYEGGEEPEAAAEKTPPARRSAAREEPEEEEPPARPPARKAPAKATREEPEEEAEEETEEVEEERPAPRKKVAAPAREQRDDGADDGYTQPPAKKAANGAGSPRADAGPMTSAQRLKAEMEARRAARK